MRLAALAELSLSDRVKVREAAQSSFVISEEKQLKLSGPSGRSRLLVLDGWLARSTSHRDGRRQIIGFYVPGDVITPGTALNFAITTDLTSVGQATLCPAPEGQSLASAYVAAAAVEQAYLHRQVVRLGRMNAFERVEDWMWEMRDRLLLSGMAQPEEQIAFALKQAETGTPVAEVIRRMGISEQTFYRWKKVYGGLGVGELRRVKQLEEENRKLKQLVADLSLDKHILQDVLAKKL